MDRLRENAARIRRALGAGVGLVPMVKADAYGLGLARVVDALRGSPDEGDPWAFGVAAVPEGEALRSLGWTGRVLVFSPLPPADYARAAASDLTPCISELAAVEGWADLAAELGRRLPFHLEIDTGMGRAGLPWQGADRWGPAVFRAAADRLQWEGTYTHFHSADEPDLGPTDEQWRRFQEALGRLPEVRPRPLLHAANSAAIFRRPRYGCDIARPGIYLYGGSAGPGVEPVGVAAVRARLVLVREVPAGSTLGYGATHRARRRERWGTLAIGYGDGIPRALSMAGGRAIVRGRFVPLLGRVSMDMITVDLSELPAVGLGEVATLIGEDGDATIGVDEVAERCGTISYEILTGLGARLPRVYLDGEHESTLAG